MPESGAKNQDFNKGTECLYRNGNRLYSALVKVNGKQIRRSLKTTDLAIAKRRLVEFRAKARRLEGEENRNDAWKRKRGATVSARSHNIELETLKLILRYAVDRGIVLENAAEKLKRRKQPKSIIELPSHVEFRVLVKTLREAPLAVASGATAMVEFLAYSGMRVGEAREVRFEDVNLEVGSVLRNV